MEFSGKVVLITGASGGIGASCALHFAKLSAKLALVGRNVENLKKVADQCENAGKFKPLTIIADVSMDESIERIVKETLNHFNRLDVLVNNAGILSMTGIGDVKCYDRLAATNIRGPYMLTQLAIPHLTKSKGNIVNISSILSSCPMPVATPYCMTKAAFDMFTKCLALELGAVGVRVNSVNPGTVATELFKRAGLADDDNKDMYAKMSAEMPLRKIAYSDDVAKLVVFLASENASCITGSHYEIDCGLHLGRPIV